ncbi:MAG: acetate--CoA ligase family protein, partial [Alphaproteobacteria bacterium]|nr:acetate--CoA ligase family protein [Alphaproteobacteria bacterium]
MGGRRPVRDAAGIDNGNEQAKVGNIEPHARTLSALQPSGQPKAGDGASALPRAVLDGVTLQAMKLSRHGRELYVGVFRDRLFGPVIAFGTGGTRIEVVRDTTLELPPLNGFLARSMIARTRVAQTLGEFRGAPAVDVEALVRML